jgi:hypothetical protein
MCKKLNTKPQAHPELVLPSFQLFSNYERTHYIKKMVLRIRETLENLDLN